MNLYNVEDNGNLLEASLLVATPKYTIHSDKCDDKLPDGWVACPDEATARVVLGLPPVSLREAMQAEGLDLDEAMLSNVIGRVSRAVVVEKTAAEEVFR